MAYSDIAQGATAGGTIGSVIPGVGTAIGALGGGALGGVLGGLLGRSKPRETKIQQQQRELVDQLLGSLKGNGPYSNLFQANPADFERTYAEPARARFQNITAPAIQQQYIQYGQQRGTPLQDTLTRAGVDMDQLLNEQYMKYLQGREANQSTAIGNILGQSPGVLPQQDAGEAALQGLGGYLGSEAYPSNLEALLKSFQEPKEQPETQQSSAINPQNINAINQQYEPLTRGYGA